MKKRFLAFLKQGLSPKQLALCVALGVILGVFPVLGSTTFLCALAAWALGLNQPAIQSVNYIVYPLQIIVLIPFYRFGEWLFHAPHLQISASGVKNLIEAGILQAIRVLWVTTLHAMVGWCLVAPLLAVALYLVLKPVFRALSTTQMG